MTVSRSARQGVLLAPYLCGARRAGPRGDAEARGGGRGGEGRCLHPPPQTPEEPSSRSRVPRHGTSPTHSQPGFATLPSKSRSTGWEGIVDLPRRCSRGPGACLLPFLTAVLRRGPAGLALAPEGWEPRGQIFSHVPFTGGKGRP